MDIYHAVDPKDYIFHVRDFFCQLICSSTKYITKWFTENNNRQLLLQLKLIVAHGSEVLVFVSLAWRGHGLLNGHLRVVAWWREIWWLLMMLPSERRVNSSPPWRDRSGSTPTCRNFWWLILDDIVLSTIWYCIWYCTGWLCSAGDMNIM